MFIASYCDLYDISSVSTGAVQSRKYYFLSEEADEKEDLNQRCRDLEHQVSIPNEFYTSL